MALGLAVCQSAPTPVESAVAEPVEFALTPQFAEPSTSVTPVVPVAVAEPDPEALGRADAEPLLALSPRQLREPTTTPPPVVVAPVVQPPSEREFNRTRVLVARAEEADAHFYDPVNLHAARAALRTAEGLRFTDAVRSRGALEDADARAREAFDNSVELAATRLRFLLADRTEELRELSADRYVTVAYDSSIAAAARANQLFRRGDLVAAKRLALETAAEMARMRDSLTARLVAITDNRSATERHLDEAQRVEAHRWAEAELAQLNGFYLEGVEAIHGYRLADAEESFGTAVELAAVMVRLASERRDKAEVEVAQELMQEVMAALESASLLTIVTDVGEVIEPDAWSGAEVIQALESVPEAGASGRAEGPDLVSIPLDGSVVVLGDVVQDSLLRQAQDIWQEGVVENQAGNYGKAAELFREARRYVDAYKVYAVKGVYTVRLIPYRRDCLWRIAEYEFIYDEPFLWPKIWRRNRELIQNPDLIHPGWQLIIPPL